MGRSRLETFRRSRAKKSRLLLAAVRRPLRIQSEVALASTAPGSRATAPHTVRSGRKPTRTTAAVPGHRDRAAGHAWLLAAGARAGRRAATTGRWSTACGLGGTGGG